MRQLIVALVFVGLLVASPARAVTTWCADATNGSDSNSGAASGTVPNLTNCKQSIEAACALLTTGDTLLIDDDYYHDPVFADTSLDMCAIPSTAANVTISSYGPNLFGPDLASDANVSAIISGTDCVGKLQGVCATATTGVKTWTNVSGNIYKTAEAAYPFFVYLDNPPGWPDAAGGLVGAACVTGTCAQMTTNPSTLAIWTASHVYTANACVQNSTYPAEWFCTTAGGTSGSTAPTCTSSCQTGVTTASDGGVTWTLEGVSQATIGAMTTAPAGKGAWFWDGVSIYVVTPDGSNPNTHVVEVANKNYAFHVNATTGNNGLNINHVGWERLGGGVLIFDTSGSGNCIANMVFDHDYGHQTGTSNIDVGMFFNDIRLTGSDPTCSPAYQVTHTYLDYCGEHGGCITGQVVGGSLFAYNNIGPNNHGGVNLTQNGTTSPGNNVSIIGNYIHDSTKSQNASVATDSVSGVYAQYTTGLLISENMFARLLDAGCGGGGQCAGILLAATTGTQIYNNTASNVQHMIAESSGFANSGLKIANEICNGIVSEGVTGTCLNLIAYADLAASNDNLWPGTSVVLLNGATNTFAQLQAAGFDTGVNSTSQNAAATFWRTAGWPFDLAPGSLGIGSADVTKGNGINMGAYWPGQRSPLLTDKAIGQQNGY